MLDFAPDMSHNVCQNNHFGVDFARELVVKNDSVIDCESKRNQVGTLAPLSIIAPEGLSAFGEMNGKSSN